MGTRPKLVNLNVIQKFLELPENERRKIQENGRGLYALLVLQPENCVSAAILTSLNTIPPLSRLPRFDLLKYPKTSYLVLSGPVMLGYLSRLQEKAPTIWVPFEIITEEGLLPIEQCLSNY